MPAPNRHDSREAWLRAATALLRPHFMDAGHPLPERIRYGIALTSKGRNLDAAAGETWHPSVSADDTWEIIIRADKADPVEVLSILVHELVHTVLPIEAGHGKLYKKVASDIGLQGPSKHAVPTPLLGRMLTELVTSLGPLPHASLDLKAGPRPMIVRAVGARKTQKTHMRKAECTARNENGELCGYTVRVASKWAELGPPGCPRHGPMTVEPLKSDDEPDEDTASDEPHTGALKQSSHELTHPVSE